jgi:hypothetical protein
MNEWWFFQWFSGRIVWEMLISDDW